MGQCYGKVSHTGGNGTTTSNAATTTTTLVVSADQGQTPVQSDNVAVNVPSVKNTPARSSNQSPWPSPYPHGVSASSLPPEVSPSPARTSRGSTPRRFFPATFPTSFAGKTHKSVASEASWWEAEGRTDPRGRPS